MLFRRRYSSPIDNALTKGNKMTKQFNAAKFESWMNKNGIKWNHMNRAEQRAAIKKYMEEA